MMSWSWISRASAAETPVGKEPSGHKVASEELEDKEEGKEPSAQAAEKGPSKNDEFVELNSSVEQLRAKIKNKSDNLKKLLVDKDKPMAPVEFKGLVKQIEKEYRELNQWNDELDKKETILRFRFPDRSFVKKKDESNKKLTLEDIGAEAVLEKEVNDLLRVVESQYQTKVRPEEKAAKQKRSPAAATLKEEETTGPGFEDFSQSLILKK